MQTYTPTRAQRHESKHVAPGKVRAFKQSVDTVKVRIDLFGIDRCPANGYGEREFYQRLVHYRNARKFVPNDFGDHRVIIRDVQAGRRRGTPSLFIKCACGKVIPLGRIEQHTHEAKFGQVTAK